MSAAPKYDERNVKTAQTIRARVQEMQNATDRICNQLNMSAAARTAAEKAYKSVICGKQMVVFQRYSDEERTFLRMMLRLALATDPELIAKAEEVAKYLGANYGYEWVSSEVTVIAREEATAMVLSAGESSFGESGTAGALGYARCHYQALKHRDVSDFGKTYALAARLASNGDFNNKHDEWRKSLGLDKHRGRRDGLLGRQEGTER